MQRQAGGFIRERFDLIMLDVVLPGMTGFAAIAALKRMVDVPIVMMTGHADEEARKGAELLGADALVAKPVDFGTLMDVIGGLGRTYGFQPR